MTKVKTYDKNFAPPSVCHLMTSSFIVLVEIRSSFKPKEERLISIEIEDKDKVGLLISYSCSLVQMKYVLLLWRNTKYIYK